MKNKTGNIILFALSLVSMTYNFIVYRYFQRSLVPSLPEPTQEMINLGNFVILALFFIGIYHLYLLIQSLRSLSSQTKLLWQSMFLVMLILSGITLLTDATLLSENAKEYQLWDISGQWMMLFGLSLFHLLTFILGFINLQQSPQPMGKFFETLKKEQDIWFVALNQIGVICGFLGLAAILGSLFFPIPDRYRQSLLLIFTLLAVTPWATFTIFWFFKNRGKKPAQWLDEKQILDSAYAAFITLIISMPIIAIAILITGINLITLTTPYWLVLVFSIQLSVFSFTFLKRT